MIEQPYHQPAHAAKLLNVSAFTIRRWCEWHSAHLSPGANPDQGRPRRLTDRDLEVLRHVAQLRNQGLQTGEINAQLGNVTFATVEQPSPESGPTVAQESHHATIQPVNVETYPQAALAPFAARLDTIERQQRDRFYVFAVGLLTGVAIMGVIVLLFALFAR